MFEVLIITCLSAASVVLVLLCLKKKVHHGHHEPPSAPNHRHAAEEPASADKNKGLNEIILVERMDSAQEAIDIQSEMELFLPKVSQALPNLLGAGLCPKVCDHTQFWLMDQRAPSYHRGVYHHKKGEPGVNVRAVSTHLRERQLLLEDAVLLAQLEHPNIVHLIGVVETSKAEVFYLIESTSWIDLEGFVGMLRSGSGNTKQDSLSRSSIAVDCCQALRFLHAKLFIHRRFSTHCVFVSMRPHVRAQVGDIFFSSPPPVDPDHVRFMAVELRDNTIESPSPQSDVYSLAVTLLDLYSDFTQYLDPGTAVPSKPPHSSDQLFRLLLLSFARPKDRPALSQLSELLTHEKEIQSKPPQASDIAVRSDPPKVQKQGSHVSIKLSGLGSRRASTTSDYGFGDISDLLDAMDQTALVPLSEEESSQPVLILEDESNMGFDDSFQLESRSLQGHHDGQTTTDAPPLESVLLEPTVVCHLDATNREQSNVEPELATTLKEQRRTVEAEQTDSSHAVDEEPRCLAEEAPAVVLSELGADEPLLDVKSYHLSADGITNFESVSLHSGSTEELSHVESTPVNEEQANYGAAREEEAVPAAPEEITSVEDDMSPVVDSSSVGEVPSPLVEHHRDSLGQYAVPLDVKENLVIEDVLPFVGEKTIHDNSRGMDVVHIDAQEASTAMEEQEHAADEPSARPFQSSPETRMLSQLAPILFGEDIAQVEQKATHDVTIDGQVDADNVMKEEDPAAEEHNSIMGEQHSPNDEPVGAIAGEPSNSVEQEAEE